MPSTTSWPDGARPHMLSQACAPKRSSRRRWPLRADSRKRTTTSRAPSPSTRTSPPFPPRASRSSVACSQGSGEATTRPRRHTTGRPRAWCPAFVRASVHLAELEAGEGRLGSRPGSARVGSDPPVTRKPLFRLLALTDVEATRRARRIGGRGAIRGRCCDATEDAYLGPRTRSRDRVQPGRRCSDGRRAARQAQRTLARTCWRSTPRSRPVTIELRSALAAQAAPLGQRHPVLRARIAALRASAPRGR